MRRHGKDLIEVTEGLKVRNFHEVVTYAKEFKKLFEEGLVEEEDIYYILCDNAKATGFTDNEETSLIDAIKSYGFDWLKVSHIIGKPKGLVRQAYYRLRTEKAHLFEFLKF